MTRRIKKTKSHRCAAVSDKQKFK